MFLAYLKIYFSTNKQRKTNYVAPVGAIYVDRIKIVRCTMYKVQPQPLAQKSQKRKKSICSTLVCLTALAIGLVLCMHGHTYARGCMWVGILSIEIDLSNSLLQFISNNDK